MGQPRAWALDPGTAGIGGSESLGSGLGSAVQPQDHLGTQAVTAGIATVLAIHLGTPGGIVLPHARVTTLLPRELLLGEQTDQPATGTEVVVGPEGGTSDAR